MTEKAEEAMWKRSAADEAIAAVDFWHKRVEFLESIVVAQAVEAGWANEDHQSYDDIIHSAAARCDLEEEIA